MSVVALLLAMSLRVTLSASGLNSVGIAMLFAATLVLTARATGWRAERVRANAWAWGLLGAAVLCIPPLCLHLGAGAPWHHFPTAQLPWWSLGVVAVAVAEEFLLRGALFATLMQEYGAHMAIAVTAVAFAVIHLPLYGPGVLPLDLAAGLWLGALRLASGSVYAPAVAHSAADLAAWWLA